MSEPSTEDHNDEELRAYVRALFGTNANHNTDDTQETA